MSATNPESLGDSAAFRLEPWQERVLAYGRPDTDTLARALMAPRTASDLTPLLDLLARLEHAGAQYADAAQALEAEADTLPRVPAHYGPQLAGDVYRETAHALRLALEEVRLSE